MAQTNNSSENADTMNIEQTTAAPKTLETIPESPEYPAERRQCDVCGIRFSSYIMQISHFQGADHKREEAEWELLKKNALLRGNAVPERKCPPAPAPAAKCDLCGLEFPMKAQHGSHLRGKLHRKNVELVRRGLEPEKKQRKKDNYYAKWDKQPAWVQNQALPGGCLEKALRQHTRNERRRKRNGMATHNNTLMPPIPLIDNSSASSSAMSPSPRPYRCEYQKSQSPPPTCNNTMLKPPMYDSSSASSPSPASYGGEYQIPQSSPSCNMRAQSAPPQNRTLGPIGYVEPLQQQQFHANTMILVPALPVMPSSSTFNNPTLIGSAQQPQPLIIPPSCNLFGYTPLPQHSQEQIIANLGLTRRNTLNCNNMCPPNTPFVSRLNNALNLLNAANPIMSGCAMVPVTSVSLNVPQSGQAAAYTSRVSTLNVPPIVVPNNPSMCDFNHFNVNGPTVAQSAQAAARTPSASNSSSAAKDVDTTAQSQS